ncbi:MAG: hypothetical protein ACRDYA_05005 [Egibacteraceae bacterium]
MSRPADAVQRVELSWLVVLNVYLDAYARAARAAELVRLRRLLEAEAERPVLVIGDFNLAPRPEDGRYDGLPSSFNSDVDRTPFVELLATAGLIDCAAEPAPAQYSLSRMVRGKVSEFRCDLALLSDYLCPSVRVAYDHSVRAGDARFTDHSAVLIDLPVTPEAQALQGRLLDMFAERETGCQPHKTAMSAAAPLRSPALSWRCWPPSQRARRSSTMGAAAAPTCVFTATAVWTPTGGTRIPTSAVAGTKTAVRSGDQRVRAQRAAEPMGAHQGAAARCTIRAPGRTTAFGNPLPA